ncbi:hypothetical protein [Amycolatopsis sp. MtRt-6]|uniref:hypothetical protein n=1 Tax=Amycolatopsis sp. MtRt-6 TaxID=2792782 RepID=UPI001A901A03|nr:hypothetical protein [Amycolatopsis sp. MtRt-6]
MTGFFGRTIHLSPRPAWVLTVAGFLGLVMLCRPGPRADLRAPERAGVGVPQAAVPASARPPALAAAVTPA